QLADVRFWPIADIPSCAAHVRFRGKADMDFLAVRTCTESQLMVANQRALKSAIAFRVWRFIYRRGTGIERKRGGRPSGWTQLSSREFSYCEMAVSNSRFAVWNIEYSSLQYSRA